MRNQQGPKSRGGLSKFRIANYHEIAEQELARGFESENRTEEALKLLAQKEEIFNYYRCDRGSECDQLGWDFLVMPEPDWMIGLQVKSSERGKEDHVNRFGLRIPCVVAKEYLSVEALAEKILVELGLSTKAIVEQLWQTVQPQPEFDTLSRALEEALPRDKTDNLDDDLPSDT